MVNSSDSQQDNSWSEQGPIPIDADIDQALSSNSKLVSARWVKLTDCLCWIERHPVSLILLLGASWGCGQLCNYFGAIVLFAGLAWIYTHTGSTEESSTTIH